MEKLISAGVYTTESDNTYLPPGSVQTVGAFIGLTQKGKAFYPTDVSSPAEFYEKFGSNDKDYLAPTVTKYLANSAGAKIIRVLGTEGWTEQNEIVQLQLSSSAGKFDAVILGQAQSFSGSLDDVQIDSYNSASGDFYLSSATHGAATASLNPASQYYVEKVFGTDPELENGSGLVSKLYVSKIFKNYISANYSGSGHTLTIGTTTTSSFASGYDNAETPWITSQLINDTAYNLFKFHTIDDGSSANKLYKVVIDNVNISSDEDEYSTFNVLVYDLATGNILESFTGLNLDVNSTNYILNRIGDQNVTVDSNGKVVRSGDYINNSKYIRVQAASGLDKMAYNIVPFGHTEYFNTIIGTANPTPTFKSYQGTADSYDPNVFWGLDFSVSDNLALLSPIADGASAIPNSSLQLSSLQAHASSSASGSYLYEDVPTEMRSFEIGFQKGWDGYAPNKKKNYGGDITSSNVFGFDCSSTTSSGYTAFKKAIDTLSNKDEFDINLLAIPGLLHGTHTTVTSHAMTMVKTRGDVFFVYDSCKLEDSISTVVNNVSSVDNNYVATYYPWVKVSTVVGGKIKNMWVPPSVVIPSVLSFNDKVSAEWFAPAGLNRGGLDVVDVKSVLTQAERDILYQGRVNPIAKFPGQGISVWGQKTSQKKASALDRINVRRLLIGAKKFVVKTGRYITFDPNTTKTRNSFLAVVNPYFENIKNKQGLYKFQVVMDETNNDSSTIDRNMIVGEVYLQPTKAGEIISISFNLTPTGASFE